MLTRGRNRRRAGDVRGRVGQTTGLQRVVHHSTRPGLRLNPGHVKWYRGYQWQKVAFERCGFSISKHVSVDIVNLTDVQMPSLTKAGRVCGIVCGIRHKALITWAYKHDCSFHVCAIMNLAKSKHSASQHCRTYMPRDECGTIMYGPWYSVCSCCKFVRVTHFATSASTGPV
ncbi:unnamed protein product [Ectocarpus sp. 4 AP-2014]